jgi:hypothetical protein
VSATAEAGVVLAKAVTQTAVTKAVQLPPRDAISFDHRTAILSEDANNGTELRIYA